MVVMVPTEVEVEYNGHPDALSEWAQLYVTHNFCTPVATSCNPGDGPTEDEYWPKLMECCVTEDDDIFTGERIELNDMIAPGAA